MCLENLSLNFSCVEILTREVKLPVSGYDVILGTEASSTYSVVGYQALVMTTKTALDSYSSNSLISLHGWSSSEAGSEKDDDISMVATKWKEKGLLCRTGSNLAKKIQHLIVQVLRRKTE
jgi:hypothetical protein